MYMCDFDFFLNFFFLFIETGGDHQDKDTHGLERKPWKDP